MEIIISSKWKEAKGKYFGTEGFYSVWTGIQLREIKYSTGFDGVIYFTSAEKKAQEKNIIYNTQDWIANRKSLYIRKVSWITILPNSTLSWILLWSYVKDWPSQIFYPFHMPGPVSLPVLWCVRHPFSGLQARSHLWQDVCLGRVLRFTLFDG